MKVFLNDILHPKAYEALTQKAEIIDDWARIAEVDAIIVRKLKLPDSIYDICPDLKVIGFHGSGVNGINLERARTNNVQVFSVPGANAQSVAELNVALALDVAHMVTRSAHEIKNGLSMQDALSRFVGHELWGKVAGIIGMGHIGRLTAQKLKAAFEMDVIGYSPNFTQQEADRAGIRAVETREEIFARSDFIFLALPYSAEVHHYIDTEELRQMKKSAFLINSARGGLINEDALYEALTQRWIAGAACDVFASEPLQAGQPVMELPNFVPTPHIGGNTDEALLRVGMGVVNGILDRLEKTR